MKLRNVAIVAVLAAVVAGCGSEQQNPESLKGNQFSTNQNGLEITLMFDAQQPRVNGKAINNYGGQYEAVGNKIKFGHMMSTMMAGPEEWMKAEHEYFGFLNTVETYKLKSDSLILKSNDGKKIEFKKIDLGS